MQDVVVVAKDFGLEEDKAKEIELGFTPLIQSMNELKPEYDRITSLEVTEEVCAEAKELRLQFVKIRTGTGKVHKAFKDFYLAGGRFVDAWKNKQLTVSGEIEEKLSEIEKHYERIELAKNEERKVERLNQLSAIEQDGTGLDVLNMEAELWDRVILGMQKEYADRKEAEEKERKEQARRAEEKRLEDIRIREENEKLKQEQIKKDKEIEKTNAKAAKERQEAEKRELALKEEADKLRKEQEAKEAAEAEEKRKKEEAEKAKIKALAKAGDKEKIKAYFSVLGETPKIKDVKLLSELNNIMNLVDSIIED